MKHEELVIKALEVIETISANICLTFDEKITVDRKDIANVYRFAHIARSGAECIHKDWEKELLEIHKKI